MIEVFCKMCGKELDKSGALVISPPRDEFHYSHLEEKMCEKFHICVDCYEKLEYFMRNHEE